MLSLDQLVQIAAKLGIGEDWVHKLWDRLGQVLANLVIGLLKRTGMVYGHDCVHAHECCKELALAIVACQDGDDEFFIEHMAAALCHHKLHCG